MFRSIDHQSKLSVRPDFDLRIRNDNIRSDIAETEILHPMPSLLPAAEIQFPVHAVGVIQPDDILDHQGDGTESGPAAEILAADGARSLDGRRQGGGR